MTAWGRGTCAVLLVVTIVALLSQPVGAQGPFRIKYDVDRSDARRTRITGQVFNGGHVDALDVYVTAEALDARGKVVARGIAFVSPAIPQGVGSAFEAIVPAPATATKFRVRVSGYRLGAGEQAP